MTGARPTLSRLLSRLIFGSLVLLILLVPVPYGSVEPRWQAVFAVAIFSLAALWAYEGALAGRWFTRAHLLCLPVVALAGLAFVQSLALFPGGAVSYDPYESRLFAVRVLALAAAFGLLLRYCDSERRLRALVFAVIAAALASSLFGLLRQTAHRGDEGFLLEHLRAGTGYAQFINKNHFAYLAEMGLGLILGLVAGRGFGREKSLALFALALPIWAALVLANSRGGLFAMFCQLLFLATTCAAAWGRRAEAEGSNRPSPLLRSASSASARLALLAILLVTVIVGTAWLGGEPVAERVASVREEISSESADPSRTGRQDIWKATWELFERRPLWGIGLGGYWIAVTETHEGSGALVPQQAHNDYLELLASAGLVGALLLFIFLWLLVGRVRRRLGEGTSFTRAAALGGAVAVCGVAVHSLVEFGLHVTANAYLFVAVLAAAAAEIAPLRITAREPPKN